MIKELVLASMMSFGVGIGTMQHEPMQKVEPNTFEISSTSTYETLLNFIEVYIQKDDEEGSYANGKFIITNTENNQVLVNSPSMTATELAEDEAGFQIYTDDTETQYYTLYILLEDDQITSNYVYIEQNNERTTYNNYKITIQNETLYKMFLAKQIEQEGGMGTQIINNIKSGLGMIGDLANEFLIGFTALFWNSTQNQLTVFGIFSLVMLGVAITMAVVKLCMNLIRSNTGA